MYTDEDRYSGGNDNFDLKLRIFNDNCDSADLPQHQRHKAYHRMLRGAAKDHYYTNLRDTPQTFTLEELCTATRNYFEGEEYRRAKLEEWNALTLRKVIDRPENSDKTTTECLELLVLELRRIRHGLDPDLRSDKLLHNKIITACRDLPACKPACFKASTSLAGLFNDLREAIATYESSPKDPETLFADRRYHKQPPPSRTPSSHTHPQTRIPNRENKPRTEQPRRQVPGRKRCFVCGKEGCWSHKHSQEEQEESKRRYGRELYRNYRNYKDYKNNPRQYVTEYEGEECDEGCDEEHDTTSDEETPDRTTQALIVDTPSPQESPLQEQTELFLTSFGNIPPESAVKITNNLADQLFIHAITGVNPVNTPTPKNLTSAPVNKTDLTSPKNCETDPFTYITTTRYTEDKFYGIVIDTGASQRSTAGYSQVRAYQKIRPATIDTARAGMVKVQFGIGTTTSIGSLTIQTPIGRVEFHIVQADTPFLLCLTDMDKLEVYYNNLTNKLVTPKGPVLITRRFGHPFLLWDEPLELLLTNSLEQNPCLFTATELRWLHRCFGHPTAERLYSILKRAGHENVHRESIEYLTKYCAQCQKHGKSPGRFKFTLRTDEDPVFNYCILVDVMYIDGDPLLHIIDEATRYQAARWLRNLSAKHTWDTLRNCWVDTYLGPPDYITHDAGTNFASKEFRQYAASMGITARSVPVEAHWSVGMIERAHPVLRRAYEIITEELKNETISKHFILQMAVKAVNDTAGPDGLVPTLLVFGAYPRMTETDPPTPSIIQRATAIRRAMNEIAKIRATRQVNDALNQRNGPSVMPIHDVPLNSPVLVWREGNAGHGGKWTGPFPLLGIDRETCHVQLPSGPTDFRSTVVKPYHINEEEETEEENNSGTNDEIDIQNENANTPTNQTPEPLRRNPERPRRLPTKFRQNHADISVFLGNSRKDSPGVPENPKENNTTVKSKDLPEKPPTPSFVESRQKEIDGLLEKGAFEFTHSSAVPDGTRIFGSRFVDEIKNPGTEKAFEKSRLVVQAYNDKGKDAILTQSPTVQRASQRVVLALAMTLKDNKNNPLSLYLRDISQAYVQSRTPLIRDIFARPPPELGLDKGTILKIVRPLYGVPEAGNHWFGTYHRYHREQLQMRQSTYDPCLLYRNEDSLGVIGLQTDDTLLLADETFARIEEEKLREAGFTAKEREKLTRATPIKFNGGLITQCENSITLTQERHCQNLGTVLPEVVDLTSSRGIVKRTVRTKEQYVAQRARGAYIATVCQPEAAFGLSSAAQVTEPNEDDINKLNKVLTWQHENPSRGLRFVPLNADEDSLKLLVFTDASFANNLDYSSQIGFVIALADKNDKANILHWSSLKCKRVTRSVLASELYGMVHGFDIGAVLKATLEQITKTQNLPMILYTDSKSLYECLVKLGTTQEKRLMVDIMTLRQSYERREITEVVWIDGKSNPADAMTKSQPCQALRDLINSNTIRIKAAGWVERTGQKDQAETGNEGISSQNREPPVCK
jgi:hypothetical protein